MIDGLKVAVVIPCYRVSREIAGVIAEIPASVDRVIAVNDASPDDTAEALAAVTDPRLRVIRHERNKGVGGATVTGMRAAIEEGYDVVVKLDGDGQMDPADIPRLVAPLASGAADHVKGSRYHHGEALASMPRWRFVGNVGLTFLNKLSSGYWNVLDPVNGYFATRADVLARMPLGRLSERYFFESDLLVRLNIIEARVLDLPQPARYAGEHSSLSVSRALFDFPPRLAAGFVRRIFWRYLFYDVSPVAIFALLGMLFCGFGLTFGGWHWIQSAIAGRATPLGTIMIAALTAIFGFQLLLQAMILDIGNTPRPGVRTSELLPAALPAPPRPPATKVEGRS